MSTATPHITSTLLREVPGAAFDGEPRGVDHAYAFCERIARSHYENFPVGSILVPARLRKHFYAIYAFARVADDFADEGYERGHSESERLEMLDWWLELLHQTPADHVGHPIFVALAATRREFHLPIELFEDLLSAFKQDVTVRRYETFAQLLDYCRRSANPIGRLILLLFGQRDERRHQQSDDICTALQLANHWQDVGVDLDKDRVYIPVEDLARFGLTVDDLNSRRADGRFTALMEFEVARARELFACGKPLCTSVTGRLGLELRVVWLGGVRILERIQQKAFDVFEHRPVITTRDKFSILTLAIRKGGFRKY